jgi:DNA-binding IclR family transcriptional regulator
MLTIHRSLDILEYLSSKNEPASLNDIADTLGISSTSAYNFLQTLVQRGYVKHVGSRKGYTLGSSVLQLAENYSLLPPNLSQLASSSLEKLNELTGESVYLGIFKKSSVEMIANVLSEKLLAMGVKKKFKSLHSSSQGKIYLSTLTNNALDQWLQKNKLVKLTPNTIGDKQTLVKELALIRKRGFSICNEEMELGACSIAAPVCSEDGKIIGSIAIGIPSVRASGDVWRDYPQYVIKTANEISTLIGRNATE